VTEVADAVVIGAGAIGLAVARALTLAGLAPVVVEAGDAIGTGASSRNSEVIHAGIYYPTGSLKAQLCVAGRRRLYDYCATRGITHRKPGKFIVATEAAELPILDRYHATAMANGVENLALVDGDTVRRAEPAVHCVRALHSPETGIFDSHAYLLALQGDVEAGGGSVALKSPVARITRAGNAFDVWLAGDDTPAVRTNRLVNAAGLGAPDLARCIEGLDASSLPTAFYARGHYYSFSGASPFGRLIYPVAGTAGLGIHVTLDLAGQARFGPDVQWVTGLDYSFNEATRAAFVTAIRRYWPALPAERLQPAYTGIRPKISGPDEPAADFRIDGQERHGAAGLVNLFGIESPGLTASLALADRVVELLGVD
jgi:L-2-hydroxyglutarate oxidase LhgO